MNYTEKLAKRAPHVDSEWLDELIIELRLRGVSGRTIGAVVLEVDSHMAARPGDVIDSFGPAREYADALDMPETQRLTGGEIVKIAIQGVGIALGSWLLIRGTLGLFNGGVASLSAFEALASAVGVAALTLALSRWSESVIRWIHDHTVVAAITIGLVVVAIGLTITLAGRLPWGTIEVPAWAAIAVGAALFVIAACSLVIGSRKASADDKITFPVP